MSFSIPAGTFKFLLGWLAVFLFRLIPFRPPNFEPMLATVMPFSKRYGAIGSFLFGFLGIVLYDAVTAGWGSWTWTPALLYGLLGVAAHYFFQRRSPSAFNFLAFGLPATLLYDGITMFLGPVFNAQPLSLAIAGQVPFTIMHLLGTAVFSVVLSPAIYRWVIENEALEFNMGRVAAAQK